MGSNWNLGISLHTFVDFHRLFYFHEHFHWSYGFVYSSRDDSRDYSYFIFIFLVNNFQNIRQNLLEEDTTLDQKKKLALELNVFGDDVLDE